MVESALERGFLRREIRIIRPRAILLLGVLAYSAFFEHFVHIDNPPPLGTTVKSLLSVDLPVYESAPVVPFLHPSPGSPAFLRWYKEFGDRLTESPLICRLKPYFAAATRRKR
jgi:uracil-DNA glycosylase